MPLPRTVHGWHDLSHSLVNCLFLHQCHLARTPSACHLCRRITGHTVAIKCIAWPVSTGRLFVLVDDSASNAAERVCQLSSS